MPYTPSPLSREVTVQDLEEMDEDRPVADQSNDRPVLWHISAAGGKMPPAEM